MKNISVALAISLISFSAIAQSIDVGSAATGALLTLATRGVIAFCLFKLITLNLTRKNIDTPYRAGRWVGGFLMGLSILTYQSHSKSDADFYFEIAIMAPAYFVIGFCVGFFWRKFKPLKVDVQKQFVNDEIYWEQALAELNSSQKNDGLWAKCFAESNGDEAMAKASYLTHTANKFKQNNNSENSNLENSNWYKNKSLYLILALLFITLVYATFGNNKKVDAPNQIESQSNNKQEFVFVPLDEKEIIKRKISELNLLRGYKNVQLLNTYKITLQSLSDKELEEVILIEEVKEIKNKIAMGKLTLQELSDKQLLELVAYEEFKEKYSKQIR
jgi:hypothetical protein